MWDNQKFRRVDLVFLLFVFLKKDLNENPNVRHN